MSSTTRAQKPTTSLWNWLSSRPGREVTLTLKEFQLLSLLVEHAGTVFTRDQLLNTIWGYEFDGASRTVDVHVRTLRQKLGEAGRCIETVRGVGYKAESDPSKSEEQP